MRLLTTCHLENRAPTTDELWPPSKRLRLCAPRADTDTDPFTLLDDDALGVLISHLPVMERIPFARNVCKRFSSVAQRDNLFKSICVVHDNTGVGATTCSSRVGVDQPNVITRSVYNWRFLDMGELCTQIEVLKLWRDGWVGGRGPPMNLPPARNLQCLSKLQLINVTVQTLKDVRKSIDAAKLTQLELRNNFHQDWAALLKKATNLERLEICGYMSSDNLGMGPIIDAWCKVHNGPPPLRSLKIDWIASVTMRDLQKLGLEELHAECVDHRLCGLTKGHLPSMRALHIGPAIGDDAEKIPVLKTLVASCPALQLLNFTSVHATILTKVNMIADAIKAACPRLEVKITWHHDGA